MTEIWNLWTDSVLVLLFHHSKNIGEAQVTKTLLTSVANLFHITKDGGVLSRQKVSLAAISRDWWIHDLLYPSHAHRISQGTKFNYPRVMHSFISCSRGEENQSEINMIQKIPRDYVWYIQDLTWVFHKASQTPTIVQKYNKHFLNDCNFRNVQNNWLGDFSCFQTVKYETK